MIATQLRISLLAAALVGATTGMALAQGSGQVGGGVVTESPQPNTGASGTAGPAAPSGTVSGSRTDGTAISGSGGRMAPSGSMSNGSTEKPATTPRRTPE